VVSDIRIRAGQHLDAGDAVLGLAAKDSPVYLVAMVPADFLPMLQKDQAMRFSLDGFKFEYRDLTVEAVGEEAVGPTEIKRFLGQELFDAVHLPQGAQVLVKARIPARSFASEGLAYAYSDGLTAQTDIKVRSEPIIVTLLPVLKAVRR
jgi:membrane fusion protein (multidrug efflux system)